MIVPAARISPTDLIGQIFDKAPLARRGYHAAQVDHTITLVRAELQRLSDEKRGLAKEADSLRARLDLLDAKSQGELISARAVSLLNSAQRQADELTAEAAHYCQELTADTRSYGEEILTRARQQAESIIAEASLRGAEADSVAGTVYRSVSADPNRRRDAEEWHHRAAYVDACRRSLVDQLTAAFDAFQRDLEQHLFLVDPVPPSGMAE